MATKAVKVAISLPEEEYKEVEKLRKKLHASRSSLFRIAMRHWMAAREEREKERAYEEGYRKYPETAAEVEMWSKVAEEAGVWEEWKE